MSMHNLRFASQMHSFRMSPGLGRSNKFRQMQELTNDDYTDIKLYYIFHIDLHIELQIELQINIKSTNNYMPDPPCAGAASLSFQYGEFVSIAN